jgi:hypothetical protein
MSKQSTGETILGLSQGTEITHQRFLKRGRVKKTFYIENQYIRFDLLQRQSKRRTFGGL